jgi:hypothetical protein
MKRAVLLVLVLTASLSVVRGTSAQAPGGGLLVTRVCGANECKRIFNGLFLIRPGDPTPARAAPPPIGDYFVLGPLVVLGAIVALWLLTDKRRSRKPDSTTA